jgi:hypothetical protein
MAQVRRTEAFDAWRTHDLPAVLHLIDSGQVGVSDKTALAPAGALRKIEAVLMGGGAKPFHQTFRLLGREPQFDDRIQTRLSRGIDRLVGPRSSFPLLAHTS